MVLCVQIFGWEDFFPLYNPLNDTLSRMSQCFYTPTGDDEENFSSLVSISLSFIFLILILEKITEVWMDVVAIQENLSEEALENRRKKFNQDLKKKYESHLKNTIRFTALLKLNINNPVFKNIAFEDKERDEQLKKHAMRILKEAFDMITLSLKCEWKVERGMVVIEIDDTETLEHTLTLIRTICQVDKFVKEGLEFYLTIGTRVLGEVDERAYKDAQQLMSLKLRNKIICYQVVYECLKTLQEDAYEVHSIGDYAESANTVYELIYKA